MSRFFATLIVMLSATTTALAHPGWGIVQDSRGNVFFTDTIQVWKIAPDGKVSLAVGRVHTHELCIDASDNLFGEHLWYEGDATGKWGHRVWRYRPDGSVADVVPQRAGFRTDYSFVRDREGNMYWADRDKRTVIKKRTPAGTISTHATGDFRSVERMTAKADGTLYLMDAGDLRSVSPDGVVTTLVRQLTASSRPGPQVGKLNYHMGLWTDRDGRVYVAAARERFVLRVDNPGAVRAVARSSPPWSPSGGLVDADGNLWILEYNTANAQRVRRLDPDGRQRIFLPQATR
jgi:sugar lactone lactonase YvrE